MPARAWADELGSCVTDVIASRPENPLEQLAHLLSRPNARPDWNETASAYAQRHSLEQQLRVAIDAVGLTVLEDATPDAIDRLCRELRTLAQPAKVRGHRVVTYNLLSPELGEPARFPRNAAADLDPPTRLARIRARLAEHMAAGAVLCLQEVSAAWAVKLAPFFEEKRYTVVSAMYHSMVFTGYMGNLLCWPVRRTEVAPSRPLPASATCLRPARHGRSAWCVLRCGRRRCTSASTPTASASKTPRSGRPRRPRRPRRPCHLQRRRLPARHSIRGRSSMVTVPPWQRPSSAPVPPQGAPGGSGLAARHSEGGGPGHWAPSHRLGWSR